MFDKQKIHNDIHRLIAECIELKAVLRATWTRPMGEEQKRLVRVRRRLTALFVLLAFTRRRLHVRTAPQDFTAEWDAFAYHEKIAMRLMPEYSIGESATADANEATA